MACITKDRDRWVLDFRDPHGKRVRKRLPKGMTKAKAEIELQSIEELVNSGMYLPEQRKPSFSELARNWLEIKKPTITERTWRIYESHVRNHFHDLDTIKVTHISTATIEKFVKKKQKQGIRSETLKKIIVTLRQILNHAVRLEYIEINPVPRETKKKVESAWIRQCKRAFKTALAKELQLPKQNLTRALAVMTRESGIPLSVLRRWYHEKPKKKP